MIRWIMLLCILCFLLAGTPAGLFAQVNPYANWGNPYGPNADPRVRRAYRERAVAVVGPIARDFVETHGDEAVAAIFACSKPVAAKLAGFYASGELGKLPRPRDLLCLIAQPRLGDDVALWAMDHARELHDVDSFNAYLMSPLDYALGLKSLEVGAAEVRAWRLNQAAALQPAPPAPVQSTPGEKLALVCAAGFFIIIGLLMWRRRAQASGGMIACLIAQSTFGLIAC